MIYFYNSNVDNLDLLANLIKKKCFEIKTIEIIYTLYDNLFLQNWV